MIYLIRNTKTRRIKIGKAINPKKRLKALQTGSDALLEIEATIDIENDLAMERKLHRMFGAFRKDGEWFELDAKNERLLLAIFGKGEISEIECAALKRLGFR